MSIRKRESKKERNGYSYQVYFYYKDKFERRKYYSKSGFKTKKEAQLHEAQMKAELEEVGTLKKDYNLKFSQVFQEFLKNESSEYSPNTINHYKYTFSKYLSLTIGNKKIMHVCEYNFLQDYFNSLEAQSLTVNRNIKATISRVLKYATKRGYIRAVDMSLIKVKGEQKESRKHKIVDYELLQEVMSNLKPHQAITIAIGYYTGMRIAEITALYREDIDFENNTIDINKQLVYASRSKSEYEIRHILKTSKSRGKIPLPYELKILLKEYIEKYPYDPICSKQGQYFNVPNLGKKLRRDFGFTYHDLRHSFASILYTNNVDVKTTQELLRHTNVSTTLNVYTHLKEDRKLDVVNSIFNTKNAKSVPNSKIVN